MVLFLTSYSPSVHPLESSSVLLLYPLPLLFRGSVSLSSLFTFPCLLIYVLKSICCSQFTGLTFYPMRNFLFQFSVCLFSPWPHREQKSCHPRMAGGAGDVCVNLCLADLWIQASLNCSIRLSLLHSRCHMSPFLVVVLPQCLGVSPSLLPGTCITVSLSFNSSNIYGPCFCFEINWDHRRAKDRKRNREYCSHWPLTQLQPPATAAAKNSCL